MDLWPAVYGGLQGEKLSLTFESKCKPNGPLRAANAGLRMGGRSVLSSKANVLP